MSQRGQGKMENTVLYGVKRKASLRSCSQGGENNKCKGLRLAHAWTFAAVATEHLWLELTVKREGGSR